VQALLLPIGTLDPQIVFCDKRPMETTTPFSATLLRIFMAHFFIMVCASASAGLAAAAPSAPVTEAIMCESINAVTKEPRKTASVFSDASSEIFCSVAILEAPSDTTITARWIYIDGEDKELYNHVFLDFPLSTEGTRHVAYSIVRPEEGWIKGRYLVRLLIGDRVVAECAFSIQ